MKIHLVGPGSAGKTTVGPLLSGRLNTPFVDLDVVVRERAGDISDYLQRRGYRSYAHQNVEAYRSIAAEVWVMALSSGFMTYAADVHPDYAEIRAAVAESPTTVVLLPSCDLETCMTEIVRRQVHRPLGLVASREQMKIRERFPVYMALPALKVTTMQAPEAVASEIIDRLGHNSVEHPNR